METEILIWLCIYVGGYWLVLLDKNSFPYYGDNSNILVRLLKAFTWPVLLFIHLVARLYDHLIEDCKKK